MVKRARSFLSASVVLLAALPAPCGEAEIEVRADRVVHRIPRYLTGACIEDVNHEIYGGLYSQMVFGESFGEPPPAPPIEGFTALGGRWTPGADGLRAAAGDGPKLLADGPELSSGSAGADVLFPAAGGGNAGLILKVREAAVGADRWTGYEVSLETSGKLVLGRHRQNWEPLREFPCEVPAGRWISLAVRMTPSSLAVEVDGKKVAEYEDRDHPLEGGRIGLRTWQREARFRNLWVDSGGGRKELEFSAKPSPESGVSGMWRPLRRGTAAARFSIVEREPFAGRQSQRISFEGGEGEAGVENAGLNRWGMAFTAGKPYEGYLWARAATATEAFVALERGDGSGVLGEARIEVKGDRWERIPFEIFPGASERRGRLAIKLKRPGSIEVGHAFLQPGEWGRFEGLPDRKDVAEALIDEGITVLRYGGSMINHPEYRWKKMIGPRDRRPPHRGTWYPYSSNGWGIFDFLDLCEAAGFLAIPAVNMDETPGDMADFIDYVNGPADGEWGRRRAADGHPAPYGLRYLELGNEERVDAGYFARFKPLAEAIWAKDRDIILVVGDFAYGKRIEDPWKFDGAAGGITSLAAQRDILELARKHDREVWFDVHVWTDGPGPTGDLTSLPSYIDALEKVSGGARHKVAVFEFNAGNHRQRRALGNALAVLAIERLSDRLAVSCSANCLQPDGQNDNGWDQGLLFLDPNGVWLQPPGHLLRMFSRSYQPLLVETTVRGPGALFDANAKKSDDGKTLVLHVANCGDEPVATRIAIAGFEPSRAAAIAEELAGPLDAGNTAEEPGRIRPRSFEWRHGLAGGKTTYEFPPRSFTVLRFES